tara:strand:+ start:3258 stop:3809 length:552 start_codon:yes stop_codon:yes gene_type:complete
MNEQNKGGIFTKASTIEAVQVNYPTEKESWQKRKDDIILTLTLDVGATFKPELILRGYFNKNEDNSFKNNGTATKIKILFDSVSVDWDNSLNKESYELTDESLEELVDKKFCKLSYVWGINDEGKSRWNDWSEVSRVGDDEKLKDKFLDAVKNNWVRDYRPQLKQEPQLERPREDKVDNNFQL